MLAVSACRRAVVQVAIASRALKGKKRQLGDSVVESLEGCGASVTSSPHVSSPYVDDEDPDDFKSDMASEDEDVSTGAMAASPMLDESIMSQNATLTLDSR